MVIREFINSLVVMFLSSIVRSLFNDDFSNAILFYVFGLADICIFLVSAKQPSKHRQKIMDRKKIRKRKRKRPSYLNDFLDESTADNFPDHENEQIQNVQKESLVSTKNVEFVVKAEENKCCLCDESLSKAFDVNHSTGSSELTFKEVLNSMFISLSDSSSSDIPRLQFGSGFICVFCKVPIQDLDLLQHKVMGLKRVILGRAKNKIEDLKSKSKVKEEAKREKIKEPLRRVLWPNGKWVITHSVHRVPVGLRCWFHDGTASVRVFAYVLQTYNLIVDFLHIYLCLSIKSTH